MIHKMYAVYDEKAGAFLPPFFLHSDGLAVRSFTEAVNDNTHQFNKHAEDFTLFRLGTFSDDDGTIVSESSPVSLGLAITFKENHTTQ